MNNDQYFHLFANCIPVKGVNRSIICDIQRNSFEFIPNELWFILTKQSKKTLKEIKAYFDNAYDEIIDEYFDFLIKKKLGRWITKLDKGLVNLNLVYEVPNAITNCIIDFDKTSNHPLPKIVKELDELICQAVQLRFYESITITELDNYLDYFKDSKVRGIEVLLPFVETFTSDAIIALAASHPRLLYMVLNGAPENKEAFYNNEKFKVNHTTVKMQSELCCGHIHSMYFRVNIKAFTEAKHFNSCLHKKIAIDKRGNIVNCPSLPQKFGNINEYSLTAALAHKAFKKTGAIRKDDITTCKVCEFRYICSDCRAYTEDPGDVYSKPLKCGYDPHTNEWQEWSSNPLKQKVMEHYKKKNTIH